MISDHGLAVMGYPSPQNEYKMPTLSHLYPNNLANLALDRLGGRVVGPTTYPHSGMWMNLVRLTDLAIREYEAARTSLDDYRANANAGRISPIYDAINSLEEAVVATHRAVLNSARLEVVTTRKLHAPTAGQALALKQVRHHIQHMDEKLERGSVGAGHLHLLAPTVHAVEIGPKRLKYRDLASCITKMYRNVAVIRAAPF